MDHHSIDDDFDLMQAAMKASPPPRKSGLNDVVDKQENNVAKKRKHALIMSRAREFADTEALEVDTNDDEDEDDDDDNDNDLEDLIGEDEEEDKRVRKKPRRPAAEKAMKRQELQHKRDFVAEDFSPDAPEPKKKRSGASSSTKGRERAPKKAKEPDWFTQFEERVGLYEQRLGSQLADGELGWPALKDKYNALSFDSREASQLTAYLQKKHPRPVKTVIGREDLRYKAALQNDADKERVRFRKTALKAAYYTLATQMATFDHDI